jgi:hypothetical protein
MEFFIDKVEKKLIISCSILKKLGFKNGKLEINLRNIVSIKEGIIIKKKFIEAKVQKTKDLFVAKFSNFGINYLYLFRKLRDFVFLTIKLKNEKINYLVINLTKEEYKMLELNLKEILKETN